MAILNLLCAWLLAGGDGGPEVIRLKVGTEVVGVVLEFDEAKGVRIECVDDHALLDLSFDQMLPEDARRIRAQQGYLPDEPEPILVDAMKIRMVDGTEFLGVIVEQSAEGFKLRHAGKDLPLKRAGVREITPVQVDALEVYDGEELYARELAARNPADALDHYNLALFCESLQLWTRVKEHLEQVQTLEPQFKPEIVGGKVKRADLRLQSGEESDLLAKVERMAKREEYDAALAIVDDFMHKKPGSSLRPEMEKQRRLIAKAREKWLNGQVVFNVFTFIERVARGLATDGKTNLKDGRKKIESDGTKTALEMTANWLKAPGEEVQKVWDNPARPTVSPRRVSYGAGTFTLGAEAALKGLTEDSIAKEKEDAKNKKDQADAKAANQPGTSFDDKIRKVLEEKKKEEELAIEAAKKGAANKKKKGPEVADVPPTDEEWWGTASGDERTQYLLGWWAEHDSSVKIIKRESRDCMLCAGIGVLRYFDANGDVKNSACTRCKTLRVDRIIRYK